MHIPFYVHLAVWLAFLPLLASAQAYKDPRLTPEERADDLLARMTLEEKIAQIRHIHSWNLFNGQELDEEKLHGFVGDLCWGFIEGFPLTGESCHRHMRRIQEYMVNHTRLGIPAFTVAESLHGSVHEGSAIFPQNIALGATFHPALAYLRAEATADDLHYQGIRQVLAPCIDVVRDLRWGRVEECYGEDPFLNSLFACEESRGYLDNGISPMLKHFGPHGNPQGGLNLASVNCGVGELHDIYLQPFRRVVTTLPVQAVMSAYNAWNRQPNSSSRYLLTEVLREQWGFEGYVYADWGSIDMLHTFQHTAAHAAEAAMQALSAGLDVEASSECYPHLIRLVRQGLFDEGLINQAVRRVLLAKFRLGLFEHPYGREGVRGKTMRPSHSTRIARRIAEESIVLLKNEGNLLPLDPTSIKSMAVIGPNADQVQFGDYSWSRSNEDGVTPLKGIRALAEEHGISIHYAPGCDLISADATDLQAAVDAARKSDIALLFCGSASASLARDYHAVNCGEGFDLSDLSLTGGQTTLIQAIYETGTPVVLVLVTGKPFALPWEKEHLPAILVQWYGGEQAGNAIADVLFGRVNPSGHLPVSFPRSAGHLPCYYNHLPSDRGFYRQPGTPEKPGRDYVFSSPQPLWAFGHGLSYTDFDYSGLEIKQETDSIKVFITVRNTGKREGMAVPQLYVRDLVSSVSTPVRQLKAVCKINLTPGESARVPLHIAIKDLALTNEKGETLVEPGEFECQMGDASDHILWRDTLLIGQSSPVLPTGTALHVETKAQVSDQPIIVQGCVRDVQATPVKGVEIYSQSRKAIVGQSGDDGMYRLQVPANDVLTFRKAGYINETMSVGGQTDIQVKMRYGEGN